MEAGRPSYGYDAPGIMRGLLAAGAAAVTTGAGLAAGAGLPWIGGAAAALGLVPLALGTTMAAYSTRGKMRVRDMMLDLLPWRGDEHVLDVGTGAGLLLIGAAKRTPAGRAVGVDVWVAKDLSGDARAMAERNARIEGVADRVEILTADARALPMPDATFDRVVSLLCLHNIEDRAGQDRACAEIARVLKPGGTAVIGDYVPTGRYSEAFGRAGLRVEGSEPVFATALGPAWLLRAEKPADAAQA